MGKEEDGFQARIVRTFHLGVAGAVLSCSVSRNDKIAASCSTSKNVLLWDVASGRCIGSLDGHKADVTSSSFGEDLLATASKDGVIFLWKYKELKRTSRIDVHAGPVHSCEISPNCTYLASASEDKTVRVYTIRGGDGEFIQGPQYKELGDHTDSVNDVSFSSDSCAIVTACNDSTIKVWDATTGECLVTLGGVSGNKVIEAKFSADDRYIVALEKKCVSVWSISKQKVVWSMEDEKGFQTLTCHPTENMFTVLTNEGAFVGYKIQEKKELFKKNTDHRGPVLSCNFSLSGQTLVTGGIDGIVIAWQ